MAVASRHDNRGLPRALRKARIAQRAHSPKDRKEQDQRRYRTDDDRLLATNLVGPAAHEDVEAHRDQPRNEHDRFGQLFVHAHRTAQEREAIEERCVPDYRQHTRHSEQGDEDAAFVSRIGQAFDEGVGRSFTSRLHRLKYRAFRQLEPHPQRNRQQCQRQQEGNAPTPCGKVICGDQSATSDHNDDRQHEAADHACLDEAGVEPALFGWSVFGDIDCRASIFSTQRETLEDAQADHDDWCDDADTRSARDQPDPCSRDAHQRHGDEEGVFAAKSVAKKAEQDRAQGAEAKADRKPRPDKQELQGFITAREERGTDQRGQRAVNEEIIPFEDRPRATGGDHESDFLVARTGDCGATVACRHD